MPKQTDSIELTNSLQGTVEYTASQEIIPEEKILEQGSFTYTSNGERTENPSEGYDGFSNVAINVNVQPNLQSKSVSYTENNNYTVEPDDGYQGLSSVAVNVNVPQGPVEAPENDVEFIDYDGTIVYSYTAQEFLTLDAMPANPTHEGLTAQGWNWTLADAKEYVGDYGGLVIGQTYITTDGKTRIYISLAEGRTSPYLGICPNGTVNVDWGDGTNEDVTGSSTNTVVYTQHNYADAGDYVIKITVAEGEYCGIKGGSNLSYLLLKSSTPNTNYDYYYRNSVIKVELGNGMQLKDYAFAAIKSLESISICYWGNYASLPQRVLAYCDSLGAVVIPNGFTAIYQGACLQSGIKRVSISNSITAIASENFAKCKRLEKIYIPDKSGYTYNTLMNECDILRVAVIPKDTAVSNSCIRDCHNLREYKLFAATSLGNSIYDTWSLTEITIPSTVTAIANYAIYNCYSMKTIKFEASSPAPVAGSNAFASIPTDCKIYVPSGSLSAYTSATNYPNPSTYTYVEY